MFGSKAEIQSLPWACTHTQLHLPRARGESIHQTRAHWSSGSPQQLSLLKPGLGLSSRQSGVGSNPRQQPHSLASRWISRAVTCCLPSKNAVEQTSCAYKGDTSLWCCKLSALPGAVSPTINHPAWNSCWPPRQQLVPCARHICNLWPDSCSVPLPLPLPACKNSPASDTLQKSLMAMSSTSK